MTNPKRVLIFDTFARIGGGLAYLLNIANALKSEPHDWEWIFYCNPSVRGKVDELEKTATIIYGPEYLSNGGIKGYIHRKKILQKVINDTRPDAIITMNQLNCKVSIPSVVFFRNALYFSISDIQLRKLFTLKELIRCTVLYYESLKSITRSNCVLTASNALKELIKKRVQCSNETLFEVVPFGTNSVTLTTNNHNYLRNTKEILFLQYNFYKGFDVAIRALNIIVMKNPETRLTITDSLNNCIRKQSKEIKNIVDKLVRNQSLRFVGPVNQSLLKEYYAHCDIFWFPSYIESFGQGLLEAMSNGIPCVASNISVFKEIGSSCISYFPAGDFEKLAAETMRLFISFELREKLGTDSKIRAKNYTWGKHVMNVESVLNKLVE